MLVSSLVITFLSFSRNSILSVAGAVVFALIIALLAGHFIRIVSRALLMGVVVGAVAIGVSAAGGAVGAGDWIDKQVGAYSDRVVTGFQRISDDSSAQLREEEVAFLYRAGAEHPLFGSGFGYRQSCGGRARKLPGRSGTIVCAQFLPVAVRQSRACRTRHIPYSRGGERGGELAPPQCRCRGRDYYSRGIECRNICHADADRRWRLRRTGSGLRRLHRSSPYTDHQDPCGACNG